MALVVKGRLRQRRVLSGGSEFCDLCNFYRLARVTCPTVYSPDKRSAAGYYDTGTFCARSCWASSRLAAKKRAK